MMGIPDVYFVGKVNLLDIPSIISKTTFWFKYRVFPRDLEWYSLTRVVFGKLSAMHSIAKRM